MLILPIKRVTLSLDLSGPTLRRKEKAGSLERPEIIEHDRLLRLVLNLSKH
jgi:hypothetical protein